MMFGLLQRGDRMVVTDPDGGVLVRVLQAWQGQDPQSLRQPHRGMELLQRNTG
ncbi:hypothetical protein [Xanthomonas translucens]|uniref:hypothetical protein n=1 Tax=Xanthomonas campestris pv. translucens TaxID=343 RepID=UPI003CE4B2EF